MKLRQAIEYQKKNMNKIRFIINYRVVPAYVVIVAVILLIISVLMSIDGIKYTPTAIALFIVIGTLTLLLLLSVPFVRSKEIELEMRRYDFNTVGEDLGPTVEFQNEDVVLAFDSIGVTANGTFHWYNHLKLFVYTSNYLNHVLITLAVGIDENTCYGIPFSAVTVSMIKKFAIKLENQEVFNYILENKKAAFTQIYKTGRVFS